MKLRLIRNAPGFSHLPLAGCVLAALALAVSVAGAAEQPCSLQPALGELRTATGTWVPATSHREGLQVPAYHAMETVLEEAKTLDGFLRSPELRDRYFRALSQHLNRPEFTRESYDTILKQLDLARREIPGFGKRLFETEGIGKEFTLDARIIQIGRTLDPKGFQALLTSWRERLVLQQPGDWQVLDPMEVRGNAEAINQRLSREQRRFEDTRPPAGAKNSRKFTEDFYKRVQADPEAQALAAWAVDQFLQSSEFKSIVASNDADAVVHALASFREQPVAPLYEPLPASVVSLIRTRVPTTARLLEHRDAFHLNKPRANEGVTFKPVPRRFHSVFGAAALGECVGGACSYLASTTPERWAAFVLGGTEYYEVFDQGEYKGFVALIPVRTDSLLIQRRSASLELGAPILAREVERVPTGRTARTLFDLWFEHISSTPHPAFDEIVVSDAYSDNSGVMRTVRSRLSFILGERRGFSDAVKHVEPGFAKRIVALVKPKKEAESHAGNMITSATDKNANQIFALNRMVSEDSPEVRAAILDKMTTPSVVSDLQTEGLFRYAASHPWVTRMIVERIKLAPTEQRSRLLQALTQVQIQDLETIQGLSALYGQLDLEGRRLALRVYAASRVPEGSWTHPILQELAASSSLAPLALETLCKLKVERPEVTQAIIQGLQQPGEVRSSIFRWLQRLKPKDTAIHRALLGLLQDPDPLLRSSVYQTLSELAPRDPEIIRALRDRLRGARSEEIPGLLSSLKGVSRSDLETLAEITGYLSRTDRRIDFQALFTLRAIAPRDEATLRKVAALIYSPYPPAEVPKMAEALRILARSEPGQPWVVEVALKTVRHARSAELIQAGIEALSALEARGSAAIEQIALKMYHDSPAVRIAALRALTQLLPKDPQIYAEVVALSKHAENQNVRAAAAVAVKELRKVQD